MQIETPEEATVSVDIEASPEQVWHALTTNDGLATWMGEGSSIGTDVGDGLLVDDVVTGDRKQGRIEELQPGKRLGYRWWPEGSPERSSRVAITLEPCESGTRVTVIETRPVATPVMASASAHANWGWRTALLVLAAQSCALTTVARL